MDRREPLTRVDILIASNQWWDDQFQFGDPADQTWTFTGLNFYLGIKKHESDTTYVATFTSLAGQIVVEDAINRVLGMLVPDTTLRAVLSPGKYIYDLIMVNPVGGQTDGLMYGDLEVVTGITIGPS